MKQNKNLVTKDFEKSIAVENIYKSKGPWKKGKGILGQTKSGKHIYFEKPKGYEAYKDWTIQDHEDAAKFHYDKSMEDNPKSKVNRGTAKQSEHYALSKQHKTIAEQMKTDKIGDKLKLKESDELTKLAREHPTLDVLAHDFKITDDKIRVCVTKASYSQLDSTRKFLQEQGFNVKGGEVSAEAGPDYQVLIYKRI